MKVILLSQRVDVIQSYNERRDCIDQAWCSFVIECGYLPILVPNNRDVVDEMLSMLDISAIFLTGGNDLAVYGGNAPERDEVENHLIKFAIEKHIPLLGVCRGAQMINCYFGGKLEKISGHVATRHNILFNDKVYDVNSFHNFGLSNIPTDFDIVAKTKDDVVKIILHKKHKMIGIMWHPERETQVQELDKEIIKILL